ncbi:16S rRNA (guanine(527)-N(7))-methyltransferase RsmG [Mailhella massiliensis]|uniref:16S rRNA (guanine(527)-N(7))-methyltransferase RsmG n=1 Tax=Mailhella massiliensis TaxID=1903261 RepID=UPI00350E3A07
MARPEDCSPALIQTLCEKAGFTLSREQGRQLAGYLSLLMQWNRKMNLVGARHWRDALEELVMDSFHLSRFLQEQVLPTLPPAPVAWDLGAGAGLPGIPLRILWQEGSYWMVESRDKRTIFLSTVLARCPLKNTRVFRGRAEQFMEGKKADLIVSRAFMPWKELLGFVRGHLTEGGSIVFLSKEELKAEEPMPWEEIASTAYAVGKDRRWFCAFKEKQEGS